jgi:hypothetical protein
MRAVSIGLMALRGAVIVMAEEGVTADILDLGRRQATVFLFGRNIGRPLRVRMAGSVWRLTNV